MGILTEDMQRVVRVQRPGFVTTVCPDTWLNLSPKGTTTVWDDDHLTPSLGSLHKYNFDENRYRDVSELRRGGTRR